MNIKFGNKKRVISSFDVILEQDEKAELSFNFNEWTLLIGLIFKEDSDIEKSRFSWSLENVPVSQFDTLPLNDYEVDEEDSINGIDRPLFICTNWNKPNIIYEPKQPIGEHEDSGEVRVRMSSRFKNNLYHVHLMFYSCNEKPEQQS